jgi:TRAP-type C4-dicarboxylate transport system permease small subunit
MTRDRLGASITQVSSWAAGICLAAVLLVTALQVFCRYVLGAPLRWPEELSRLLFIWLTFSGCIALPWLREHLAIEFVYEALPPPVRVVLDLLADLLGLVFFGALAYGGYQLVQLMAGMKMPALQWPTNMVFGFVAATAALQSCLYLTAVVVGLIEAPARLRAGAASGERGERE